MSDKPKELQIPKGQHLDVRADAADFLSAKVPKVGYPEPLDLGGLRDGDPSIFDDEDD